MTNRRVAHRKLQGSVTDSLNRRSITMPRANEVLGDPDVSEVVLNDYQRQLWSSFRQSESTAAEVIPDEPNGYEEQEKLEAQHEEELDASSAEVDANFSVRAGNLRLFAKTVPPVEESGRICFGWYLSLSVRTEDGVTTTLIDDGKCMTENNARRAAFRSMNQYVKTMSQIAEAWSQTKNLQGR